VLRPPSSGLTDESQLLASVADARLEGRLNLGHGGRVAGPGGARQRIKPGTA
jgi:hypothetical protein